VPTKMSDRKRDGLLSSTGIELVLECRRWIKAEVVEVAPPLGRHSEMIDGALGDCDVAELMCYVRHT
jgi:hypothetical protein